MVLIYLIEKNKLLFLKPTYAKKFQLSSEWDELAHTEA